MKKRFSDLKALGRSMIGTGIMVPAAELVEIAGYANFDFVIIDEEHTQFESDAAISLVRAAEAADIVPIIRVPEVSEVYLKKALDTGVSGVVVPNISDREAAEKAVYYARFAPVGGRGACPGVRANRLGMGDRSYYENANRDVAVIALIEGAEGMQNFDEIIRVPGLDAIYIGPVDLSVSLGLQGDVYHPRVIEAMERLIGKAKAQGHIVGTYCTEIDDAKKWIARGVDFIDYSTDTTLFMEKCQEVVNALTH
jgi:4-hydroxy-2-oxoheptanedioate aldolase